MDLEPRYIEDNIFEVEEWFAKGLLQLSIESQTEIVEDLVSVVNLLPITDGWEQKIYGVILNEDIFYVIQYLKEEGEVPLIIDLEYVDVNEYLDAILINNTIKSYYDEPRKKEQDY
jgi:hypothetical protein